MPTVATVLLKEGYTTVLLKEGYTTVLEMVGPTCIVRERIHLGRWVRVGSYVREVRRGMSTVGDAALCTTSLCTAVVCGGGMRVDVRGLVRAACHAFSEIGDGVRWCAVGAGVLAALRLVHGQT